MFILWFAFSPTNVYIETKFKKVYDEDGIMENRKTEEEKKGNDKTETRTVDEKRMGEEPLRKKHFEKLSDREVGTKQNEEKE